MNVGASANIGDARKRLERMRTNTADLSPAFLRAGVATLKAAAERIDAGGPGWAPNVTGTALLHQTGRLLSSLTVGGSDTEFELSENQIVVGTNVTVGTFNLGKLLQEGTGIYGARGSVITAIGGGPMRFMLGGRVVYAMSIKGMPPRPFLFFDESLIETIRTIFAKRVMAELDGDS